MNTKEKILVTALRLFAVYGYEAVSVSRIAGELGITKGALYKHYKNKRDIFNCIFEYVCQLDVERSRKRRSGTGLLRYAGSFFSCTAKKFRRLYESTIPLLERR